VLRIARTGAVKSRTAAFNQLKDLIITAPDSLRETLRDKTLQRVAVESARLRPDTSRLADPTQATKLALRTIAVRAAALNTEITALDTQLGELVTAAAPRTLALLGVGTEHAAQLLITAGGNPERLRSEASFAALCAASPIPASSGKTNRHRLNPAGDREANRALHVITLCVCATAPTPRPTSSDASQRGSRSEKQSAASNVTSPARPTTRSAQTSPQQPLTIYRTITQGSHVRTML
jgi:transposase